jgi:hypothetical protein
LARSLELLEYPVEIVHSGHLGLTSTFDTASFLKCRFLRASYAIRRNAWKDECSEAGLPLYGVLRSSPPALCIAPPR